MNVLAKVKSLYSRSIQVKLLLAFLFTTALLLCMNIVMYGNTNKMLISIDKIYAYNISLNDISETLEKVQLSMTAYLNTRASDAMEDYYRYYQDYSDMISDFNGDISENELLLSERDIKNMSENYLALTNLAIDGKRGSNIEKYRTRYEESERLYKYLQTMITNLNNERFKVNAENYKILSDGLRIIEIINIILLFVIGILNVFIVGILTESITRPLRSLAEAAEVVADGNFDIEMVMVTSKDEVGVVTKAFNQMVVNIREYIDRLRANMETERAMKEKELLMEAHLKDAKLKYLQAQINPHFLFNTLNAGAQLAMMEDAEKTYTYVQRVADFFRYNISKDQNEVTLREEIALVDTYIYILNVRFAGDIHFSKDVDESLLDTKLPGMTLQPIVENSVNYGIRNIDREGHIKLRVYGQDNTVCISIKDNGIGIEQDIIDRIMTGHFHADENETDSNGVGLDNVINRLKLYFGEDDVLNMYSEGKDKGTETIIYVQNNVG